ncbi:addiction module protein [Corallococcus exercitus]|uniref:addiction module protein n=1 Tax=Corallococcus exercitus TaxID=2316736 RepID=UPI0035D3FEBE
MATREELLAQALRLSPDDRARLAHELLDSLGEGPPEDVEQAWGEEISRRAREVLDGTVELLDFDDVLKEMKERMERRRR